MKKIFSTLLFLFSAAIIAAEPFLWQKTGNEITLTVAPEYTVDAASVSFFPEGVKAALSPVPERGVFTTGIHRWRFDHPVAAVTYQGCRKGLCFPPARHEFAAAIEKREKFSDAENFSVMQQTSGMMNKAEFLAFLRGKSETAGAGFWAMALLALLGGIALNLTPCVLPLAPVNLAIIGADGGGATGFRRGLYYGAGMAIVYGILGLFAALAGTTFGALNSKWYFNFLVALLFFLLAAASAGFINFDFLSRFNIDANKLKGGRGFIAFCLGAFAALLAGACVAPVVTGVLLFTAEMVQQGEVYAVLLPVLLGIGMALPWPLAGAGLGVLPKPGKWMNAVKYALALLIAAMGVYYAYIGFTLLRRRSVSTASDPFAALNAAAEKSRRDRRPVLVEFTASWCKNCLAMKQTTLADSEVQNLLQRDFHVVVFAAENPAEPRVAALLKAWRIPGFPAFVIVRTIPQL